MASLRDKTISGLFWSFLQKIGTNGISFFVIIILARLLTPEDFGLIGMLLIFIALSQALTGAGFSQALIQKKNPDKEDYSSVFYINIGVSVLLYFILFITAPFIADFYNQPLLINLARVLSFVFVINAFCYVQEAKLTKEMQFKTLAIIYLPSTIIGGAISITMASMGYGVWSIVALHLVQRFAFAVQIWIYAKWKPLLSFNKEKAKSLFAFGNKIMLSTILNTIFSNIFLVVIGKFFPLSTLGYYQNAKKLVDTPTGVLSTTVSSVTFPAFSSIQDDNIKLKKGYKRSIQQLFFWLCPFFIIAGILADPLFRFVLTEKWMPAVPYFRWLCIVGILHPLNVYNLNLVNVKGRSDIFLKLTIVKKVFIAVGLVIAIPFGIYALLILQAINSVFAYILNSHYAGRFIEYPLFEQLKDIASTAVISIIVGLFVYVTVNLLPVLSDFIILIIGGTLGVILYIVAAYIFKIDAFLDFKSILQGKLKQTVE